MDYQKLITELKDDIDNYSFDDSEYDELYNRAYSNLEAGFNAQNDALSQSYYNERRRAVGENALGTKNSSEKLAARGLARSGESADMIIGQNIALNNRLSDLSQSNTEAKAALMSEYGKERTALDKSLAELKSDAMESEKAAMYDRLKHLENLYSGEQQLAAEKDKWMAELEAAERKWQEELSFDRYAFDSNQQAEAEKWKSELTADENKWREQLAADREKWQAELDFDRYTFDSNQEAEAEKWKAELTADEEKWREQLDAENAQWKSELEADEEKWREQLDADNANFKAELEAEAEADALDRAAAEEKWRNQLASEQYMQQVAIDADREEWQAKLENDRYEFDTALEAEQNAWVKDFAAERMDWVSNTFDKLFEGDTAVEEIPTDGLLPDVTVQSMANNIVSRYGDKNGGLSEYTQEQVYSDFARLIATSDLNKDYATQVLATLRSKGFEKEFSIELALEDYVNEGYEIYNQTFDEYYLGMVSDGTSEDKAFEQARDAAEEAVRAHVNEQGLDRNTRKQVLRMYGINY